MWFLSIDDWKMYFEPYGDITKETEDEISFIFGSYYIVVAKGEFKAGWYPSRFLLKEKLNGVSELIKGWELESMFLDKNEVVDVLNKKMVKRLNEILNESELLKKFVEELPYLIMGKELKER